TDANILHNTLYANTATGGSGGGIASQNNLLVVRNNIVDFNTGSGIDAPAGTDIDYNNVVHNTGGGYSGGAGIGASDIMTGPSYIDSGSDNYHLQDDSAGVDEADPASPVTTDFDGDLRPTNSGPDMGADEINSCLVRVIDPSDSSENLFGVLQDAINFAESFAGSFALPDVEIARGECRGVQFDAGLNTSQVGYVQENLRIIGSLQRSNFSDPDDLHNGTVDAVSTILNAEENGRVLVIAPGTAVTLTQVALVNGDASAGGGNGNGGAIHNPGAEMLLEETAVCQNQAVNGGGYYGGASATADITGVRIGFCVAAQVTERANGSVQSVKYFFFDSNNATGNGGGLYAENRFDIRNASFYGNVAGNDGGGLYNGGNNNRIINGTFYSNTATVDGGGLYDAGSGLALYHNTLLENLAAGGSGGAVWHNDAGFTMNSSIVYNNTSANTGGGLSSDSGTLSYNNFNSNTPDHTPGNVIGSFAILANPQLAGTLLSVDSPAIDMADPDLLITGAPGVLPFGDEIIDYDRQLDERPDGDPNHTGIHGKGADIGSDEYVKTFGCSITPPEDEATAVPGQTVTYNFTVLNSGNTTDTITMTLQTSQGWGVLQNGSLQAVILGGQESVNRTITVTIPTTATTGIDVSTIGCQSASKLSRTDSSSAFTTVGLVAGVIVTPDYNDTALPGDIITYTHQVTNKGNEEGRFRLTPNAGPQHASAVLVDATGMVLTDTFVTLLPDESATVLLRVNILPTAAANALATPGVVATEVNSQGAIVTPLNSGAALNEILIGFAPGTRHVAASGAADTTNCTDPANPCATIQYAHDQSVDNDTILISTGTYTDTITRTIGASVAAQVVYVEKSLTIRGGYNVADSFTSYEPITNAVTLSGEDVRRVFFITDGVTVTLSSLFVENGASALQGVAPTAGGAIYNNGANLTITGTWFTANNAQFGGVLYHKSGNLNVGNAVFANNSGSGQGGAVYLDSGSTDLINNTFVENTAAGDGGAVYAVAGSLDLFNNIFSDNGGSAGARAVYAISPAVVLSNNFNLYWSALGQFDQTNFVTGTN
ncbi:MAG: hypothetical protein KC419_20055, partial [Anaerolineales bacterium]|nr:hypothetical protein [Anaerolineales bacterium]